MEMIYIFILIVFIRYRMFFAHQLTLKLGKIEDLELISFIHGLPSIHFLSFQKFSEVFILDGMLMYL